ncbi:lysophospholipid acyltransferase family protein [Pseudoroseomonas cervicalis]|uniref:lysophospholipid acyltransferase family protein n=1 Tax=Teichococcus cervicalis TaxID=204525 RepID=UPI0027838CB3|nr:hypothetical protein [Pseudoroseomonas cervicalis]MDQ1079311.1 KDO2-lipid IV(A) lauroyltransferase [Pseudoroseomonas cervicalis]
MAEAAPLGQRLRRWLDGARDLALHEAMRHLPTPMVSDIGAALARRGAAGRHRAKLERAEAALARLRPDLPEAERRAMALRNFIGVGRAMAEFACMGRLWREGRIAVQGRENIPGGNFVLALLHLGNWEAMNAVIPALGLRGRSIYQPPSSPVQHRIARRARQQSGNDAILASVMAPRQAMRVLEQGEIVGIFLDEYKGGRVNAPRFGRPPGPGGNLALAARLAARAGLPVVPAYTLRGEGARFTTHFLPPLRMSGELAQDVAALEDFAERTIHAHLEQWFMLHVFRFDR